MNTRSFRAGRTLTTIKNLIFLPEVDGLLAVFNDLLKNQKEVSPRQTEQLYVEIRFKGLEKSPDVSKSYF